MAISDRKKRVAVSLSLDTLEKLEILTEKEKNKLGSRGYGQFTQSNVLEKLIEERFKIMQSFGD